MKIILNFDEEDVEDIVTQSKDRKNTQKRGKKRERSQTQLLGSGEQQRMEFVYI